MAWQVFDPRTGVKTLSLSQALRTWKDQREGDVTSVEVLYQSVAWIYRCLHLRANGLASMPFTLYQGDTEINPNEQGWAINWKRFLWRTEAARCVSGAAYWLKQINPAGFFKGVEYLNYQTMNIKADAIRGITGFRQTLPGEGGTAIERNFTPEQVLYMPLWTPDSDVQPGVSPAQVSLVAAGITKNANEFMQEFFLHGAMPTVLISTEGVMLEPEQQRLKGWFERMMTGVKRAFRPLLLTNARGMKVERLTVNMEELAMADLHQEARMQVAAAFGVRPSMLEQAANYATAEVDLLSFYTDTVFPEADLVEEELNAQLWGPLGYRWDFQKEQAEVVQKSEASKAKAYRDLVEAGIISPEEARIPMGFPEHTMVKVEQGQDVPTQEENSEPREGLAQRSMTTDLYRWRRVAIKEAKASRDPSEREFYSNFIPAEVFFEISDGLRGADEEEVNAVFAPILSENGPSK